MSGSRVRPKIAAKSPAVGLSTRAERPDQGRHDDHPQQDGGGDHRDPQDRTARHDDGEERGLLRLVHDVAAATAEQPGVGLLEDVAARYPLEQHCLDLAGARHDTFPYLQSRSLEGTLARAMAGAL